ncbi:ABC transporter ATP-binding protein [Xanthomonas indica]|uniref:ABC transporter ATP-binding protein n=1 Tax=Xanthomonas indica TaxID=2912242 RepID=A0AAU8I905_9XANT|nr:ABC transporter ATP-binding protein [Xanthomonas indica]MCI2261670.1 ABC transporter ATP-binding protein [Xanthomonas indica]
MNALLSVKDVGKSYSTWRSEWMRVLSWFGLPFKPAEQHWVLRNISFAVGRGESVGIVGQNGAGKSTLLKMITGTSQPSCGHVIQGGKVAAILELGMGFNPDLTGRQNVFHAAGLMGHAQGDIAKAIGDIEAFAEIGEYFDAPVRTYSSGMQMRVAFSVATAFRPDLLIVDEALSVGDAYFVHKCFDRIKTFQAEGTSLLFVSHDPTAVQVLCDRAILLDGGTMIMDGEPKQVMDYYNALIAQKEQGTINLTAREDGGTAVESGTGEAVIESVALLDAHGKPTEYVAVGEPVRLRVGVRARKALDRLVFGYMIRDRLGQAIFGTNTFHTEQILEKVPVGRELIFDVDFQAELGPGTYSVSISLSDTRDHLGKNYQWRDMALVFSVANLDKQYFVGTSWLPPQISISGG